MCVTFVNPIPPASPSSDMGATDSTLIVEFILITDNCQMGCCYGNKRDDASGEFIWVDDRKAQKGLDFFLFLPAINYGVPFAKDACGRGPGRAQLVAFYLNKGKAFDPALE